MTSFAAQLIEASLAQDNDDDAIEVVRFRLQKALWGVTCLVRDHAYTLPDRDRATRTALLDCADDLQALYGGATPP